MATGSEILGESSVQGSDECYQFSCSPCYHENKEVKAVTFCVECEEYLCSRCLVHHNRLAKLRTHEMLDENRMKARDPTQHVQHAVALFVGKCTKHHGHLMDMFCETHDIVCCNVCSTLEHGKCQMKYLPDVAKGTKGSAETSDFTNALKRLYQTLESLKQKGENDLLRLEEEKKTVLDDIGDVKERLLERFEQLENAVKDELNKEYIKQRDTLREGVAQLDQEIKSMEAEIKKLEDSRNDVEAFFRLKVIQEDSERVHQLALEVGMSPNKTMSFKRGQDIAEFMTKTKSLGNIFNDIESLPAQLYSIASAHPTKMLNAKSDRNSPFDSPDSCLLSDQTILLADWNNKCIKRLDSNYTLIDVLEMPCEPGAVAELGYHIAAVSLQWQKKIQLIEFKLTGKMTKTTSFKIHEPCRGMDCQNSQLFLACGGGSGGGKFKEGPGQVLIYSEMGQLLRKIMTDKHGEQILKSPRRITINRITSNLHVCDSKNGLITLDKEGNKLHRLVDSDLEDCTGIAQDGQGQLFICSFQSNSVMLINREGNRKLGTSLIKADYGIDLPKSLCYDSSKERLIVSMQDSNTIKVLNLRRN